MASKMYYIWENTCKKLGPLGETDVSNILISDIADNIIYDNKRSPLTDNNINDRDYFRYTLRLWQLTNMKIDSPDIFDYYDDLYRNKSSVRNWISNVFRNNYDRYIISKIVLGDKCVYYWSFKKEFRFFFKKISDTDKIYKWTQRFIELAEERKFYDFASYFAENAMKEFSTHNILTNEMKSTLTKHIRRG